MKVKTYRLYDVHPCIFTNTLWRSSKLHALYRFSSGRCKSKQIIFIIIGSWWLLMCLFFCLFWFYKILYKTVPNVESDTTEFVNNLLHDVFIFFEESSPHSDFILNNLLTALSPWVQSFYEWSETTVFHLMIKKEHMAMLYVNGCTKRANDALICPHNQLHWHHQAQKSSEQLPKANK